MLHDRVDEWVVAHMPAFDGKSLQSVTKGDLDLGGLADSEEEARQKEETEASLKPLVERIRKALGDKAKEVRLTHRLVDSPACLVTEEGGISANLERVLRAAGQAVPNVPLVLEINPEHPIVTRLKDETDEDRFKDWKPHPLRSGDAGRGRASRRSGRIREAAQRADAGDGRRTRVADLDTGGLRVCRTGPFITADTGSTRASGSRP